MKNKIYQILISGESAETHNIMGNHARKPTSCSVTQGPSDSHFKPTKFCTPSITISTTIWFWHELQRASEKRGLQLLLKEKKRRRNRRRTFPNLSA